MVLLSIKLNMIFNLELMPTIPRDDIVGISYIYIKTMRIV